MTETASTPQPNLLIRLLRGLWHGVDTFRKLLHLALLLLLFGIVLAAMNGGSPILPAVAALVIQPNGDLVEQFEGDPFEQARLELAGGESAPQTVVQDVVDALEHAANDDRIRIVQLELSGLSGGGLSKLQRIADAMTEFRASGKRIVATADYLSQAGYYLAAHADEAYLHPEGLVLLQGYGSYRMFYKDAIDTLRIDWNVFRVGSHKSFVEPYTRTDMSDEAREDLERLTGEMWQMYQADVESARGLDAGTIADFSENLVRYTEAAGGDLAAAAVEHGLLDGLRTREEIRDLFLDVVGSDDEFPDQPVTTDLHGYLAQMRLLHPAGLKDRNVAIIVASGDITVGSPPPGMIGADSTSELLRDAMNDDSIAAVVLRIDSPGGSTFASDVISDAIGAVQAAGKPVVASMGSVAASGGYWIAAGADRIYASPSTVTGSIGIFGMFPTFQRSLEALGLNVDGVGSTPWAGEFRADREMSEPARELFQLIIDEGYDDFISRVARYRHMEKNEVDAIAQGRVWTGADAMDKGLIDELGQLEEAVKGAAELAELGEGEYGVTTLRRELTPTEQFLIDLMSVGKTVGLDATAWHTRPGALERVADRVEAALEPVLRFNDPKGVYSHCLCKVE